MAGLVAASLPIASCAPGMPVAPPPGGLRYGIFVPGYLSDQLAEDDLAHNHLPNGWQGRRTLLTRLNQNGDAIRSLFPIRGHGVKLSSHSDLGIFASMSGERMATFDPRTLDLLGLVEIDNSGFIGGGHADFLPFENVIAASERAPYQAYGGRRDNHIGRIALRDPATLNVIERYSCHGIAPHDISVIPGTRLLAIANYGSTLDPTGDLERTIPFIVEPSISVIDLDNGQLVEMLKGPDPDLEVRHLAASADSLFAIQVRLGDRVAAMRSLNESLRLIAAEHDRLAKPNSVYLSAPMLGWPTGDAKATPIASDELQDMRQGLSILYEPEFDEVIATFPSSHRLLVVDRAQQQVKHVVDTTTIGINYPCGLALHPDGRHYVLTGSFKDAVVMRRGAHHMDPAQTLPIRLFQHSHIAAG